MPKVTRRQDDNNLYRVIMVVESAEFNLARYAVRPASQLFVFEEA